MQARRAGCERDDQECPAAVRTAVTGLSGVVRINDAAEQTADGRVGVPPKHQSYRQSDLIEDSKMHMSGESLLIILLVGIVAGWLAGQIVQGTGFGLIGDLIVGIVGAFIGSWVLPRAGIHLGAGL